AAAHQCDQVPEPHEDGDHERDDRKRPEADRDDEDNRERDEDADEHEEGHGACVSSRLDGETAKHVSGKPVRIGCSGWSDDDWRDRAFYPPRLAARNRFRYYATQFDTVELNASFYRLPLRTTAERWAAEAPAGFRFAVKVSRYLTHIVRLTDTAEHLALLLERVRPLIDAGLAGPLLWQLPPTFRRDDARLADALAALPTELRYAL